MSTSAPLAALQPAIIQAVPLTTTPTFLAIPLEIRWMVYKMLLCCFDITLVRNRHTIRQPNRHSRQGRAVIKTHHMGTEPRLAILFVCRQVYEEACLLPYKGNVFWIYHADLPNFLIPRTPPQLQSLRSLVLYVDILYKGRDRKNGARCFNEISRDAAAILPGIKELQIWARVKRYMPLEEPHNPWLRGVQVWIGRNLDCAVVKLRDIDGPHRSGWRREADELKKRFEFELMGRERAADEPQLSLDRLIGE